MINRRTLMAAAAAGAATLTAMPAMAADAIKIGNTNPYSGPASAYGQIGRTVEAYFEMINAEGGVNGRQIEFISYDDAYSPPKTVEQVRRLVEQDEVDVLFGTLGTPTNTAIHKYVNAKKVPHLFVATGASKWNDPENFPWTSGWQPNYPTEGAIYAQWILANIENPRIAVLYQNDDSESLDEVLASGTVPNFLFIEVIWLLFEVGMFVDQRCARLALDPATSGSRTAHTPSPPPSRHRPESSH